MNMKAQNHQHNEHQNVFGNPKWENYTEANSNEMNTS